jgi:cytochrome P450
MTTIPPTKTNPARAYVRHSRFIIDVALEMRRKGMLQFFTDVWREHGDLAHLQIGPGHIFLVTHPEHVRHVSVTNRKNYDKLRSYDAVRDLLLGDGLVSSRGELWRRQRRLMAPFFTPRGIEPYYPIIVGDGRQTAARWEGLADRAELVDMLDEMMIVTAAIILRTMFSIQSDAEIVEIKDAVETMIQFVATRQMNPIALPLWAPTRKNQAYHAARARVHAFIDGIIAQRRALPESEWPDDLLSKLMLARDEETGAAMPDALIRDESITIFFAGHETTARTLAFLWAALDQNPGVAARLHAELDRVLPETDAPRIEDLRRLPYTLQVIKETLRLYPPAPIYVRDAVADDEIDGVHVPAGAQMMLFPILTHRHPDFWDAPEQFDPQRWLPEREAARHPYAYHPFAAGQRICIGNNFSLFESHILTAMLARRFAPRLAPGHTIKLEFAGTLAAENGLPMVIHRR